MPWGASRLHDPSALEALKSAVTLADDSPTGLRWRQDYTVKRVTPGSHAGTFNDRLRQFTIHVKGFPLYSRHAVWMLANDQPIPRDMDIKAVDGDLSNLKPGNLVPAPKAEVRQSGTDSGNRLISVASKRRLSMPDGISLDPVPWGFVVTLHIRAKAYPLPVHCPDRKRALYAAVAAAIACGYEQAPLTPWADSLLPAADYARITQCVNDCYIPLLVEEMTPSQQRVKEVVRGLLKLEKDKLIAELQAARGEGNG